MHELFRRAGELDLAVEAFVAGHLLLEHADEPLDVARAGHDPRPQGGLGLTGLQKEEIEHRTFIEEEIIDLLEIEHIRNKPVGMLPYGMQKRVELGRALALEPELLILDEPTSGLDVMATRSLRELILKLKDEGRCVLFSSHIMQEVAALCDDICIIAHGKVAIDDSIDGIRQRTGCDDIEDAFVEAIKMVEPVS